MISVIDAPLNLTSTIGGMVSALGSVTVIINILLAAGFVFSSSNRPNRRS